VIRIRFRECSTLRHSGYYACLGDSLPMIRAKPEDEKCDDPG
jgi:hypothetical protein